MFISFYRLLSIILLSANILLAQPGYFHTAGREIVDPDGKPVLLRGINLGNWLVPEGYMFKFQKTSSPRLIYQMFNELLGNTDAAVFWKKFRDSYITKEDITFIKSCGFNSIRIPFHYQFFISIDNPEVEVSEGLNLLKRVVKWCEEENLYVILDMHCAPGGQTGDNIDDSYGYPALFESETAQEATIKAWVKIAREFKTNRTVIGYDLLNEPIAHYFNVESLNPKLEPFFKKLISEIRKVDDNHIVFIGGAQWNSNFKIFGPPFDKNSVYTFHKYWTPSDKSVIQEYIDYREKFNVPIWMGESGENTNEWIAAFRKTLEENNIGWCFWPYKKMDATSSPVSVSRPADYDTLIAYSEKDRSDYGKLREHRIDKQLSEKILNEYLENIKLKNCRVNREYIEALLFAGKQIDMKNR